MCTAQLFWMFALLYGLPVMSPAYAVTDEEAFYHESCVDTLLGARKLAAGASKAGSSAKTARFIQQNARK